MDERKRVTVWVQSFKGRKSLMLQWHDPETGQRKSKSAKTDDADEAERHRADLEYELNHNTYQEASRMTWERFRELFEEEYIPGTRPATQRNFLDTLNLFERLCQPTTLRAITERSISAYAGKVSAHVLQKLMRHANIKTTLDYYANIDAAVEEAVLGTTRNSSHNPTSSQPSERPTND